MTSPGSRSRRSTTTQIDDLLGSVAGTSGGALEGRQAARFESMEPIIDHIQITVRDLSVAEPFYDKLLPLLGFDLRRKGRACIEEKEFRVVEYTHPRLAFAITSPRTTFSNDAIHRRRPGALHHLAFQAESRAEVDGLHAALKGIGATIVRPPREYPEYTPAGYYALFFKDPEGIKYEIVCHEHSGGSRGT
jgi:catechol 2,3-dioxygenase-like lactoylglutathione lyase family enzyme